MTKKISEEDHAARSLSDPSVDAAGAKLREAFRAAEKAVKAKMTAEFGDEFIRKFMDRMRDEVNRLPLNIEEQVSTLLRERLDSAVNGEVQNRVREFWGDFIQKEIEKKLCSSDVIILLAKKIKELI